MRIAVLGCGSIGQRHLKNLLTLGYSDLVSFDPSSSARQQTLAAEIACLPELEAVWARNPQVVFVTAPTNSHVELALESARRDCHLFIEKPLSHSLLNLDLLCAEVARRSLITMIGCNMRFHPGPAKVHELIEQNRIGDIVAMRIETGSYLPSWRTGQDYARSYSASAESGGAILDCIHEIDLALWFGGPAKLEAARWTMAKSIGLDTDGLAELILHHENGVLTNVHLNFIQRDYRRACQVIGARGTIYWDFGKGCVDLYNEQGRLTESFAQRSGWSINEMYLDELSYFMKCVESNSSTSNAIAEACATLKIAVDARNPINRAA